MFRLRLSPHVMRSSRIALSATLFLAVGAFASRAEDAAVTPAIPARAEFFRLSDVLLGPGPFADAMAKDAGYLLKLDPDRLLNGFRANAGLEPKAPKYGGWEARGLAGHTLGHYLTGLGWFVEATGEPQYRAKLDYTVAELALCQTGKRGGLISAIPDDEKIFAQIAVGDIRPHRFDLNGGWVPWYNLHKLFEGLYDAHVHGGNPQALVVLRRLADWADRTTAKLTPEQFQQMLYCEHGGMNEVLAQLYALTGEERYLRLARRFCDREVLDPLSRGEDRLDGFHANTQIPKLVGAARLHQLTGDDALGRAARMFWQIVVRDRTWVTGGNSEAEHFFPPEQNGLRLTHSTAETCNTYNMLRLTEQLYALQPRASWFDYFERALYNHILGSIDPATGQCTYFVSLRPGFFKYYGDAGNAFWCCTGTGLENHAKYGRGIYAHQGNETLFVNLFIASTLTWQERGVVIEQRTRFPAEPRTELIVRATGPTRFTLAVRVPAWVARDADVRVNGVREQARPGADGYVAITREWNDGDSIAIALPMNLRVEPLAHTPNIVAILYGPVVLAGELGRDGLEGIDLYPRGENQYRNYVPPSPPVLVAEPTDVLNHIEPVPFKPLTWRTHHIVRPADLTLVPFYAVHHERHVVYWTSYTPAEWPAEEKRRADAEAEERALAARTVDDVVCGEQQPEVDHHFRGERAESAYTFGHSARWARNGGWFEYRLAADPARPMELQCTWWGGDTGRVTELLVDGEQIAAQAIDNTAPDRRHVTTHAIPAQLTRGQGQVVVRFRAPADRRTGQLYSVRMLRGTVPGE